MARQPHVWIQRKTDITHSSVSYLFITPHLYDGNAEHAMRSMSPNTPLADRSTPPAENCCWLLMRMRSSHRELSGFSRSDAISNILRVCRNMVYVSRAVSEPSGVVPPPPCAALRAFVRLCIRKIC